VNRSTLSMVLGIIAIAIAFVVFPIVLDATDTVLSHTGNVKESDSATTDATVTTADIVLDYPLYNDDVANVVSITSSDAADTPSASAYAAATKTLTVSGLAESTTRTLTTTYVTESMGVYTGLGSITKVAPLMVFMGLLAGGGFGLYKGIQGIRAKA